MTAAASISVVVPALDAGEVIDDCLDAILAQEQCPSCLLYTSDAADE